MKKKLVNLLVIILCTLFSTRLLAQGKAFETVRYTAVWKGTTVQLFYADGYIGASKISLKLNRKKVSYIPETGIRDGNGEIQLDEENGNKKYGYFVLRGIDDMAIAPKVIRGSFYLRNKAINLIFYKNK